ncbi:MAG: SpoIID/LytB domain-containing protein [Phycisphaerae bacterium]
MLPHPHPSRRLEALARWMRRLGPARCLALVLFFLTLSLLGCYALTERRPWQWKPKREPPPQITVDRMIRVRLFGRSPQTTGTLEVTAPFSVSDALSDRVLLEHHAPLPKSAMQPAAAGGLKLGDLRLDSDDVLIFPQRDASLVVNGKTYRGLLRIRRVPGGLALINQVDLESYLRGVLRGELPWNFHLESFKAQCVAARTYALYQKSLTPSDRAWDVLDNEGSQMYIGVAGEARKAVEAVEATRGQVCAWNDGGHDAIFCTYYSSTCGGMSQHVNNFKPNDPAVPPLVGGVACDDCYLSKHYRWGPVKLSKREVTRRIVKNYPSVARLGPIIGLRPKELTPDGRIVRIQLDGATGQNETLMGEDFRLSIGGRVLKSTCFVIETEPDFFVFRNGKGYGHGVGLCQHGMETKARRGMPYDRILAWYYPTSKIMTLYH